MSISVLITIEFNIFQLNFVKINFMTKKHSKIIF